MDVPASSELTRKELGWEPERLGLLDDIKEGGCYLQNMESKVSWLWLHGKEE